MSKYPDEVLGTICGFVPQDARPTTFAAHGLLPILALQYCDFGHLTGCRKMHVKWLLKNQSPLTRRALLLYGCKEGWSEVVQRLLDNRIQYSEHVVPVLDKAFALAAKAGRAKMVACMLSKQVIIDPKIIHKLVLVASARGHIGVIKNIMSKHRHHAKIFGPTTLYSAIEHKREKMSLMLLTEGWVDLSKCGRALDLAATHGCTTLLKYLLVDKRVRPSSFDKALASACMFGQKMAVKMLLADKRADPSAQEQAALIEVVEGDDVEMVKILLADKRVDPSARNQKALITAAKGDYVEMVRLLLTDSRIDESGVNWALNKAARHNRTEVVRILITDTRVRRFGLNLALFEAAKRNNVEMLKILLADRRIGLPTRDQVLIDAKAHGYTEIVELLQAYKVAT